jgi:methylmalonyl-CoA mutase
LAAAGPAHIYLAGKPGEYRAALERAGIGTFVFHGCDTLGLLQDAYARLGA